MYAGQTFDFSIDGSEFRATIESDYSGDTPWDDDDGCSTLTRECLADQARSVYAGATVGV